MLDPNYETSKLAAAKRDDQSIIASGVELHFTWDPYLNSTRTLNLLARRDTTHKNGMQPAMVVLGTGLWELKNLGSQGETKYLEAIDRIIAATGPKSANTLPIADEVILIPVEQTIPRKLDPNRAKTLTPARINSLNEDLRKRLPPYKSSTISNLSVLYALNKLVASPLAAEHTADGLHYDPAIVTTSFNMMLNLRCNDAMPKKFPFDKTCCMQYPAPNWLQTIIIVLALVWAPLGTHYYASSQSTLLFENIHMTDRS